MENYKEQLRPIIEKMIKELGLNQTMEVLCSIANSVDQQNFIKELRENV